MDLITLVAVDEELSFVKFFMQAAKLETITTRRGAMTRTLRQSVLNLWLDDRIELGRCWRYLY
jgi:hypothetical protein